MHRSVPTLLLRTFSAPVELRTPRVLLRQWKDSDCDAWAVMNADPAVRRYFASVLNRVDAQAEADRIRSAIAQRGWGMWALEVPGVHAFAGFVGLNLPDYEAPWMPAVEIGWRLPPAAWHQGYATESAIAALDFAFTHLELPQVVALSVPTNGPSHSVMERTGMVRDVDANFDHPRVPVDSPLKRHILHRVSPEQWRGHRNK